MAARENQGYLIAVIILVLLTLILALAAFLGISKASEFSDNEDAANARLLVQEKLARAEAINSQIMEAYIGGFGVSTAEVQTLFDSLDKLAIDNNLDTNQKAQINEVITRSKRVKTEYEKDMKQYIASEGDESQEFNWRGLTSNLGAVVADKHIEVNVLRNDINRIQNDAQKTIEQKQKELDGMQATLTTKQNEFDTEKKRAEDKIVELRNTLGLVEAANEETNKTLQTTTLAYTKNVSELKGQIDNVTTENVTLKDKVNRYEKETFDLPDGHVVRMTSGYVYLDLGSADGLRTNRTFSIYDQEVTNFEKGSHKATIEVTAILGPHQAEARITFEDIKDPIVRGDYVLTPTWDPGSRVAIALVGMFDLDGDDRSDRERLVQMIENNGGRVVAQHDDDGVVTGKVDSATRYLVLGNSPDPSPATPDAVYSAIDTLRGQAKTNSVQEIDLKKLLNWMGLHNRAKIERLDSEIGNEFRRRDPVDRLEGDRDR